MRAILQGLAIGAAGGAASWAAGLPAPWLAGSMLAAVVAVFSGIHIGMPSWLRDAAFLLLGIQTGTSVTWETVDRAAQWPLSIALLAAAMTAVTWGCTRFYVRLRGWDMPTAFFASLPGALGLVVLLADRKGVNLRRVMVAQCIRLGFLVACLPALISLMAPGGIAAIQQPHLGELKDVALVVALSAGAGFVLEWLRVPAGLILGAVLASAALELSGAIAGTLPDSLLIPTNIILGVLIAARFMGFTLAEFGRAFADGLAGFAIALGIAAAGAAMAAKLAGIPFALTLLAFSPGGLDAMTLMSFALGLDPAFVGSHQIVRYVGMALVMPAVVAWLIGRAEDAHALVSSRVGRGTVEDD